MSYFLYVPTTCIGERAFGSCIVVWMCPIAFSV